MVVVLGLSAFVSFAVSWFLLVSRRKTSSAVAAALAGAIAAIITPVIQLWLFAAVVAMLRTPAAAPTTDQGAPNTVLAAIGLLVATVLWLWVTLIMIGWFTIPISMTIGVAYCLLQRWIVNSALMGKGQERVSGGG
jgi:hypothetical protein